MRRRSGTTTTGRGRRLRTLGAALLLAALPLAALVAVPSSGTALAQEPPADSSIVLVNADDEFVERKGDGRFIARPLFDRQVAAVYYGVRDGDTGEWLSAMYRVRGGEKERRDGWEYSFEYPFRDEHPALDPERAYLLVILAGESEDAPPQPFYGVIPIHQPGGIWNKILGALDPGRWGKAIASWVIEGAHGTLCGVVERAAGDDADACEVTP